ncbi:unnamed protein product [marine sediment metagenome]|uniref:Uncharacterized protein n=1 Tax=marine sediment metagenome TaxID=412755 RepID=X0THM0_9ZZZZ
MWLWKLAEYPEMAENYDNVIKYTLSKTAMIFGVTLTEADVYKQFAETMELIINQTEISTDLTVAEQQRVRELLLIL